MAFLNSFYEEQVAILLLPLLAFAVALYLYDENKRWVWIVLTVAMLVGWSKTAFFYFPTLALVLLFSVGVKRFWHVLLLGVVSQLIAIHPVVVGEYKKINPYHSIYFGALVTLSDQEIDGLSGVAGKPLIRECVGVAVFFPKEGLHK